MIDVVSIRNGLAYVNVKAMPRASANKIGEVVRDTKMDSFVKVYVTATPESGKANICIIELLSSALGVPKTDCMIVKGIRSRTKVLCIQNVSEDKLNKFMELLKRIPNRKKIV
jgi:uncharacterized protein YggU (UPF0235/DUF167 family)